jgi:hypothetical protein
MVVKGRNIIPKKTNPFLLYFDPTGRRAKNMADKIIRGK